MHDNTNIRALTTFAIAIALGLLPGEALAQINSIQPVESTLDGIQNVMTGALGTSVAVVAVIILGVLALFGRLSWFFAGSVIAGIVLIFGSVNIVDTFVGGVGG